MNVKLTFPEALDIQITEGFMRIWQKSEWLNNLAITITRWTSIVMLILMVCIFEGLFLTAGYRTIALESAVLSIVAAFLGRLVNEPIAKLVSRSRPFEELRFTPLAKHDSGESFPSNHSTGAFALAFGCIHVPGYNAVLLILALCLAVSRIYCGLHYASDVMIGTIHGILAASLCLWIAFSWL
jgi:undecaprenyl-diphosphatase